MKFFKLSPSLKRLAEEMMPTGEMTSYEFHWELREPFGNLQNPTQMLSYDGMKNRPLQLANINNSSAKISFIESFFEVAEQFRRP
jgi:hypothetical protein